MGLLIDGREMVVEQFHHLFDIIVTQVEGVHDGVIGCQYLIVTKHAYTTENVTSSPSS
jgi:hypothetical protein